MAAPRVADPSPGVPPLTAAESALIAPLVDAYVRRRADAARDPDDDPPDDGEHDLDDTVARWTAAFESGGEASLPADVQLAVRAASAGDGEADDALRQLAHDVLFARHAHAVLRDQVARAADVSVLDAPPWMRRLRHRWQALTENWSALTRDVLARRIAGVADAVDRVAEACLAAQMQRHGAAAAAWRAALATADEPRIAARAHHGLAIVAYHRRRFDAALTVLQRALALRPLDPDALVTLSNLLIRLGRTDEAVLAVRLAIEIAPQHERAHYQLGNGYGPLSYAQLHAIAPQAYAEADAAPDDPVRARLTRGDERQRDGDRDAARGLWQTVHDARPGWVDPLLRLGALAFGDGDLDAACGHFRAALARSPWDGRAHNGLARALEARRRRWSVHREADERRFAAAKTPALDAFDDFVINAGALGARHRKQVALALAPWRAYLPVLRTAGATYYIKPLHERLSDTPGQDGLRDRRIVYDARLWDDVRGCGGYHTVTGVEDVEASIPHGYNTVLHELSHQVHSVLPMAAQRQIEALYRAAKRRDQRQGNAFLSRYAADSVWEYFAEGANAADSPRRDRYDSREIVRERLEARDPDLLDLVTQLMRAPDLDACRPVAAVQRGHEQLGRDRVDEAIAAFREALADADADEQAHAAMVYALLVAGRCDEARATVAAAITRHPASALLAMRDADVRWLAGDGLPAAIAGLEAARPRVPPDQHDFLDGALGRLHWLTGDAEAARRAYDAALAAQADQPSALWGRAASSALGARWDDAWRDYERAVRLRSGLLGLRTAFAFDLLRADQDDRAKPQIDAALGLDPDDPTAHALMAWWQLRRGRAAEADARLT
ncbi:MAG: tetratricopeptide repeat protein, partial [Acidobacteriota bacterium]